MYKSVTKDCLPYQQKGMNAMYNVAEKKINRELTSEEEKTAFLYTSKINSARFFAKHID